MDDNNVHWLTIHGQPEICDGQPCGIVEVKGETEIITVGMTEKQITYLISSLQALRGRVAAFRKELKN